MYSNEVWSGIEYQVAAHLIAEGEVEKGLEIVRTCRNRYDGRVRNPFNEYECGSWYARALSSYSLLQALTGVRYDAVDRTLHIAPRIEGDFITFFRRQRDSVRLRSLAVGPKSMSYMVELTSTRYDMNKTTTVLSDVSNPERFQRRSGFSVLFCYFQISSDFVSHCL